MKPDKLQGIIPAVFTPMNDDCTLNGRQVKKLADALINNGVSGFFVAGTTGETASLTIEERKQLAEWWRENTPSKVKLIIHVGNNALAYAKELAEHAAYIKADAISTVAPGYFKPAQLEDLIYYCRDIAEKGNGLPFYFYHIPSITGVSFRMIDFIKQAEQTIPTFRGVKFTYEDLMDYRLSLAYKNGKFDMLFGRDEMLLSGLALGAKGAVGSTYNFAAPIYQQIINAYSNGDMHKARSFQDLSIQLIQVLDRYGGALTAGKSIMRMLGLDCGPCRLPLKTLNKEEEKSLEKELQDIEFFDHCIKT